MGGGGGAGGGGVKEEEEEGVEEEEQEQGEEKGIFFKGIWILIFLNFNEFRYRQKRVSIITNVKQAVYGMLSFLNEETNNR